jgi:hypothetical protein
MTPSHREVIETDAARCHPSPSTNGSEPSLHRVDEEPPSRAKVIQLAVEAFGAAVRPAKKGTG